jgi:hypothetical protein
LGGKGGKISQEGKNFTLEGFHLGYRAVRACGVAYETCAQYVSGEEHLLDFEHCGIHGMSRHEENFKLKGTYVEDVVIPDEFIDFTAVYIGTYGVYRGVVDAF